MHRYNKTKDITGAVYWFTALMVVIVILVCWAAVDASSRRQPQIMEKISLYQIVEVELTPEGRRLLNRFKKVDLKEDKIQGPLYYVAALLGPYLEICGENEIIKNFEIRVINDGL